MATTYNFNSAWVEEEEVIINWRIHNFPKFPLSHGKPLVSKSVRVSGQSFALEVYPAGFAGCSTGFVSILLTKTHYTSIDQPMTLRLSISLCNQLQSDNTVRMTLPANSTIPGPLGTHDKLARAGWVDFVKYADMTDPSKGFFVLGEVVVKAEIAVLGPKMVEIKDSEPGGDNLATGIHNLFQSKVLSDIKLVVDGRQFECHRAILASRSKVFEAMFRTPMAEAESDTVTIEGITPDTLQLMLQFIYTDTIETADAEPRLIGDLLKAAKKYDIARLFSLCEKRALTAISVDSAIDWLMLATMVDANAIKRACMQLVTDQMSEIQLTQGWKRLLEDRQLMSVILPSIVECMSPPAKRPRIGN